MTNTSTQLQSANRLFEAATQRYRTAWAAFLDEDSEDNCSSVILTQRTLERASLYVTRAQILMNIDSSLASKGAELNG